MCSRIGLIGHDLTGAADRLAAFVEVPGDTAVFIRPPETSCQAKNVAILNETQMVSPAQSYAGVRDVARRLAGRQLFLELGSTLRGNIGAEIRAVIDETGTKAVVCSALPREGRTVVDGIGRLNSVPLHLTEYGRDASVPCRESSIPTILRNVGLDVSCASLDVVRAGVDALYRTLRLATSAAVVVDAETEDDLYTIARAIASLGTGWCVCAASGLSAHLAVALGRNGPMRQCEKPLRGASGVLAVIGSMRIASSAQVARLDASNDATIITTEPLALCSGGPEVARWEEEACTGLGRGRSVVLTTSLSAVVPHLSHQVAPCMGALAARIVRRSGVSNLVLSGGFTALNTCEALEIASVNVLGEVEPGVVCSRGADREGVEHTIVSKSGGFGDAGTLARVLGGWQSR